VIDCYKLAKMYGQHPNSFLCLPLTEIARHMRRTDELLALIQESETDGR